MTLGRTSDNKIKIKTDGEAGLRAVSCGCCNPGPCGGCPTILGALPATGTPPVKPTSLAWTASFSLTTQNPACGDGSVLSGIIDQQLFVDNYSAGCSTGVGGVFRCYTQWGCDDQYEPGCPGGYGSSVGATLVIGKYKVETFTNTDYTCGPFAINGLVPDTSPEAECAYWLVLSGGEMFGALGWVVSSPNLYPIPLDQIIGSHQISCTVYAGTIGYGFNEATEETTNICEYSTSFTRSATITFS